MLYPMVKTLKAFMTSECSHKAIHIICMHVCEKRNLFHHDLASNKHRGKTLEAVPLPCVTLSNQIGNLLTFGHVPDDHA